MESCRAGVGLMLILALGLSACHDAPTSPGESSSEASQQTATSFSLQAPPRTMDEAWRALDRGSVPGFAGVVLADDGTPVINLTEGQRGQSENAARAWLRGRDNAAANREPRFRYVEFSFSELSDWRDQMMAFADLGAVMFDADEVRNGVTIGVKRESDIEGVRAAALEAGIPERAVFFRVVGEGPYTRGLDVQVHGGIGGTILTQENPNLQGDFRWNQCTATATGFRVRSTGSTPVMVTASHCTTSLFLGDEDYHYQRFFGSAVFHSVAREIEDPEHTGTCDFPGANKGCRGSDAALLQWEVPLSDTVKVFSPYRIAKTEYAGQGVPGSRVIPNDTSWFTVTDAMDGYDDLWIGRTVNKVGKASGWTKGAVSPCPGTGIDLDDQVTDCDAGDRPNSTCFNMIDDSDHRFALYCQYEAELYSTGGDSGSPIFANDALYVLPETHSIQLLGVLWGGPSVAQDDPDETITWFSPWNQVVQDLNEPGDELDFCMGSNPNC